MVFFTTEFFIVELLYIVKLVNYYTKLLCNFSIFIMLYFINLKLQKLEITHTLHL